MLSCLGQSLALDKTEHVHFVVGMTIELKPPSGTDSITNIQWRHKEDIAAEWSNGDAAPEVYRNFKDRTDLNTVSGVLTIRDMTEAEAGVYSVEINNSRLDVKYEVKSVEKLTKKPDVWFKPGLDENLLDAVCLGNVDKAGPVTFWWNTVEDRSFVQLGQKIVLMKNDTTQRWETISCKMVNVGGEKESEPKPNPFFPEASNSALGAIAIVPIVIIAGLIGVVIWKKDEIMKHFGRGGSAPVTPGGGENGSRNPEKGSGEETTELTSNTPNSTENGNP